MAEKPSTRKRGARKGAADQAARRGWRWLLRWGLRGAGVAVLLVLGWILLLALVAPPRNLYMRSEAARLGGISYDWADWDEIAPVMARSIVAAEDANYCLHWGFDMAAIRQAIDAGGNRGASTITQQTVKNVFLWHGRSWPRKAAEAILTPAVELVWSKRRILEVYLNVAEFGEGIFGVEAAAQHYFGTDAGALTPTQAARLAAILPDPKGRDADKPSNFVRRRAGAILDGAQTIRADGRAACFED